MRTRSLVILVVALMICVALASTNPTARAYEHFLEALAMRMIEERGQNEKAQRLASSILPLIRSKTIRRNYGLFSIFETDAFEVRVVVLGIGNTVIPIQGVREISQKVEHLVPAPPK